MSLELRTPLPAELPAVAVLAAKLVRLHHQLDPRRFLLLEPLEAGYQWFLGTQLKEPEAVVIAAFQDGRVVGYAYGALQPRDWNALLDACGAIHDLYVEEDARRAGIASQLLSETFRRLQALGAPRVVLHTAAKNEAARAFFAARGFRPTMVELTCDPEDFTPG